MAASFHMTLVYYRTLSGNSGIKGKEKATLLPLRIANRHKPHSYSMLHSLSFPFLTRRSVRPFGQSVNNTKSDLCLNPHPPWPTYTLEGSRQRKGWVGSQIQFQQNQARTGFVDIQGLPLLSPPNSADEPVFGATLQYLTIVSVKLLIAYG